MTEIVRCRSARASDAVVLSSWLINGLSVTDGLAGVLPGLIATLIGAEQLKSILIETFDSERHHWTAVGLGISGFIKAGLLDLALSQPKPWLFISLLRRCSESGPAFLTLDEIGLANSRSGADLIVQYMQGGWDFGTPLWRRVGEIGHEAYVAHHRGYRVNRVVQEDWVREPDIYQVAGYRPLSRFQVAPPNAALKTSGFLAERCLYYADALEFRARAPGSTVSYILEYRAPICGFTRTEQRVLTYAAEGYTDDQVASDLNISVNTIKQTWARIYDRVEDTVPVVLGASHEAAGKRGPEKRRWVVAFVKENPQELRPMDWNSLKYRS